PDEREAAAARRRGVLKTRQPVPPYCFRLVRLDGRQLDVESSGVSCCHQGKPAIQIVFRDITERKRVEEERCNLQEQMLHAQKLESLGVLAGGIAHDFNNLLTAILGYASLARMQLVPDSPAGAMLQEIEKGAERAADLAQQMLAYSGKGKF